MIARIFWAALSVVFLCVEAQAIEIFVTPTATATRLPANYCCGCLCKPIKFCPALCTTGASNPYLNFSGNCSYCPRIQPTATTGAVSTATKTKTPLPTATATHAATKSSTNTSTPQPTTVNAPPTKTPTKNPTKTATPQSIGTATVTQTSASPVSTKTATKTATPIETATPNPTQTSTSTPTPTIEPMVPFLPTPNNNNLKEDDDGQCWDRGKPFMQRRGNLTEQWNQRKENEVCLPLRRPGCLPGLGGSDCYEYSDLEAGAGCGAMEGRISCKNLPFFVDPRNYRGAVVTPLQAGLVESE